MKQVYRIYKTTELGDAEHECPCCECWNQTHIWNYYLLGDFISEDEQVYNYSYEDNVDIYGNKVSIVSQDIEAKPRFKKLFYSHITKNDAVIGLENAILECTIRNEGK